MGGLADSIYLVEGNLREYHVCPHLLEEDLASWIVLNFYWFLSIFLISVASLIPFSELYRDTV